MSVAATDGVTASSSGGNAQNIWFPWTFRRILALPGSPLAIGAGAVLLCFILSAIWGNAAGEWQGIRLEGRLFFLHPLAVTDLFYAVYLGFALVALLYLVRGADRDLSRLGPALGLEAGALEEVRCDVLSVSSRSLRAGTVAGLAVAAFDIWVVFALIDMERFNSPSAVYLVGVVTREILFSVLTLRVLGWAVIVAMRLSRLARDRVRVRLVDVRELQPFAQNGIRLAFFWLLLWAIWVPMLLAIPLGADALVAFLVLLGVGITLSAIAIVIPTLGAHRRIREAKVAELAEVRRAIERAREAALEANHPESAAAATRLPGLIAYEAHIAGAPEWLLDARSLGRVALYLLIPVASWVAGALVERVVDTALE
jgi:hypothetical protein